MLSKPRCQSPVRSWTRYLSFLPAVVALFLVTATGCENDDSTTDDPKPPTVEQPIIDNTPVAKTGTIPADFEPTMWWETIKLAESRIGYSQLTLSRHESTDGDGVTTKIDRIENTTRLTIVRDGQEANITLAVSTDATSDGQFLSMEQRITQGEGPDGEIVIKGRVTGGQLHITSTTTGQTIEKTLPWRPNYLGPHAPIRSMMAKPMTPKDYRELTALPGAKIFSPAKIKLTSAEAYESIETPLSLEPIEALRINMISKMSDGTTQHSELWCDRSGRILRQVDHMSQMESTRVTKAEALTQPQELVDMNVFSKVPIHPPATRIDRAQSVVYLATLDGIDPATIFSDVPLQKVEKTGDHEARITIYGRGTPPSDRRALTARDLPTNADRRSTSMAQSDNPEIRKLADQAAGDASSQAEIAERIEAFVHSYITDKNFSQGFFSAADVVKARRGDCTEHTVLLVALARAKGIPARAAMGLVATSHESMGFHMWAELFIDGHWQPYDGAMAGGGKAPLRLRLGHDRLESEDSQGVLTRTLQIIGRLKLATEKVEPRAE